MCAKFRRIIRSLIKAHIKTKEFEQLDWAKKNSFRLKSRMRTSVYTWNRWLLFWNQLGGSCVPKKIISFIIFFFLWLLSYRTPFLSFCLFFFCFFFISSSFSPYAMRKMQRTNTSDPIDRPGLDILRHWIKLCVWISLTSIHTQTHYFMKKSHVKLCRVLWIKFAHLQKPQLFRSKCGAKCLRCEHREEKKASVRKAANVKCMTGSNQKKCVPCVRCMRDKSNYICIVCSKFRLTTDFHFASLLS